MQFSNFININLDCLRSCGNINSKFYFNICFWKFVPVTGKLNVYTNVSQDIDILSYMQVVEIYLHNEINGD